MPKPSLGGKPPSIKPRRRPWTWPTACPTGRLPRRATEERHPGPGLPRDEFLGGGSHFLINGLHPLLGERAGVLDGLAALAVGFALEHPARAVFLSELRVLRIVYVLRLLIRVEMIEAAEELVEAVHRRQMLVQVALVILPNCAVA